MTYDEIKDMAHTIGPIFTALLIVALVAAPRVGVALVVAGRKLLEADPASVKGRRYVEAGVALFRRGSASQAVADKMADAIPGPVGALARLALHSLSEVELPPGSTATVETKPDGTVIVTAEKPKEPPPSPLVRKLPLLCLALALAGCADLTYARSVRDASHDAAETAAPIVERWCVAQVESDRTALRALPEGSKEWERFAEAAQARQRARHCPEAVAAYDALRLASITLDATVAAAEAGQCMSARAESCDVGGAAVKAAQAAVAVAGAVKRLEAAK